MRTWRDDVRELLETAEQEPLAGQAVWSFFTKDDPLPLEEHEVVERIESGQGVFVLELVFDSELELVQRGSGKKIKSAGELRALKRDRFDALRAPALPPSSLPVNAPRADAAKRTTLLHGALLSVPSGDKKIAAGAAKKRRR